MSLTVAAALNDNDTAVSQMPAEAIYWTDSKSFGSEWIMDENTKNEVMPASLANDSS